MGKAGSTAVKAGAWFAWLLDLIGWIILLAGVSAMQSVRDKIFAGVLFFLQATFVTALQL
jgi:hypothetical protein